MFTKLLPEFACPRPNVRLVPIEGESWPDYLIRLAEVNLFPGGLGAIARLVGVTREQLVVASPEHILGKLGIPYRDSPCDHQLSTRAGRQRVGFAYSGRALKTRVCPVCLMSDRDPFVRSEWSMPISVVCRRHGTLLVDTCQSCKRPLDIFRSHLIFCRCGADLRLQKSEYAERWTDKLRDVFFEAYAAQPLGTFACAHELSQEAARTCKWLVAPLDPKTQRRPYTVRSRDGFLTIADALKVGSLLMSEPNVLANAMLVEADLEKKDVYTRLNCRLRANSFRYMNSVLLEVKRLHRRELIPGRRVMQQRSIPREKEFYGIKDLMKVTGHSYGTLLRCIDDGGIPGATYIVNNDTGFKSFHVPAAVYFSIVQAFRETDTLKAGAVLLGCSFDALRGLVASGCITGRKLALTRLGRNRDRVRPEELRSFAEYLFRTAKTENGPHLERLYFSGWVPGPYNLRRCNWWRDILVAIKGGRISLFKAVLEPAALNDLYVLRSDLQSVLGGRRLL